MLEADPDTDWTKVDLAGLRDHLRDMDRLVSNAVVSQEAAAGRASGVRHGRRGDDRHGAAAWCPAHALQLAKR